MQKSTAAIKPADIIEMVIRRRWILIVSLCLTPVIGIYLALSLPKIYQAQNIVWVQPQRVPEDYVESIVSTDFDSRVRTISQQIMSRSNLEKIINDFSLFTANEDENMYVEDKIASLRKDISVEFISNDDQRKGRRRGGAPTDVFSISFKGQDPEKVLKITNSLTSYVIDENIRNRAIQAIGTSDFLDEELDIIRKEMSKENPRQIPDVYTPSFTIGNDKRIDTH